MSFWEVTKELLTGFESTLLLFFLTLFLSLPLGLIFAFGSRSKIAVIRWPVRTFVYIIRGTPLMLQLLVLTLGPGILFGPQNAITRWEVFNGNVKVAYFVGALIAFVINYACYFSEIYRGGIDNIPKGQWEAGQVLGMTKSQVFFKVILLQVFKNILAPISNETVTLVKDTSLANIVSVAEIIYAANRIAGKYALVWPLFYTGAFYLVFNFLVTFFFNYLEKRMAKYRMD